MLNHAIGIVGTGAYLPAHEITNETLAARFDVTTEWIEHKTRIRTRRYAAPTEATSDLAVCAAVSALDQADLAPEQIDYLIVATSTADFRVPPTACVVQKALGAGRAACFDLNIACSGFVYALGVARSLVALSSNTHALVIAADIWSRFIDPQDRSTAVLIGDGAGAAVIGPVPAEYGIIDVDLRAHGDDFELLIVPAGGSRCPTTHDTVERGGHFLKMRGREVTEFVMRRVPGALHDLLVRAHVPPDAVDHFVPHQANGTMLCNLATNLGLPRARMHLTVERYGNVGCASIPVTLDEVSRSGALRAGDFVLMAGFGSGMALGACLLRWSRGM